MTCEYLPQEQISHSQFFNLAVKTVMRLEAKAGEIQIWNTKLNFNTEGS